MVASSPPLPVTLLTAATSSGPDRFQHAVLLPTIWQDLARGLVRESESPAMTGRSPLTPPLPRRRLEPASPPPRLLPAPSSPRLPPLMRHMGRHQHVGDTQRWGAGQIEGARMASTPLPPGFASRRVELPWPPPQVTSIAIASQLHHCRQESRPDKENS